MIKSIPERAYSVIDAYVKSVYWAAIALDRRVFQRSQRFQRYAQFQPFKSFVRFKSMGFVIVALWL